MPKITIIPCADKENTLHIGNVFSLFRLPGWPIP